MGRDPGSAPGLSRDRGLLTVGFVLLMWQRQQRLKGEIARLEEQLRRVEAEDAKRAGKGGGS